MDRARLSDETLIDSVLSGQEEAFVTLVDRYQRPLLRLARAFVRDDALAEDVVQDTWIGVLKGVERFERRSSFKTWLFRVLVNRAKTRGVKEDRYQPLTQDEDDSTLAGRFDETGQWRQPPGVWTVTPERLALSDEIRSIVAEALDDLPPLQRSVVTLRDIQQLDSKEVCNILEISETNQRVLLHRGRTRVRAALSTRLEI